MLKSSEPRANCNGSFLFTVTPAYYYIRLTDFSQDNLGKPAPER